MQTKVPKYVLEIIDRRVKAAVKLIEADLALCEWLEERGLLDELETFDYYGGVEMYVNPLDSSKRVLKVIEGAGHHG